MSDEFESKLLERLLARDERAFSELVRTYEERIARMVLRMLGNTADAEDLAQEVFVQVFKAIADFRGDAKLSTWIYRIAINLCKNRLKYLRVRHADAHVEYDAGGAAVALDYSHPMQANQLRPDEIIAGKELATIVQGAILQLEPSFRECLILRDVEDLSYEDIEEITGLPLGTVKSRIFRARAQLRETVERALGGKLK